MFFSIFVKNDINSIGLVGFKDKMHKNVGEMRNEELGMRNGITEQGCASAPSVAIRRR